MSSQNLLQLAKQGDTEAITRLINRHFQDDRLQIITEKKDSCLFVGFLYSCEISVNALVVPVLRGIKNLNILGINMLEIYGQIPGALKPLWSRRFPLKERISRENLSKQLSTTPSGDISANVTGNLIGHIAIGNNITITHTGDVHGMGVRPSHDTDIIHKNKRPLPVFLTPKCSLRSLIGRNGEIQQAIKSIKEKQALDFYGPKGAGKTTLLYYLENHEEVRNPDIDGIIHIRGKGHSYEYLLKRIYDSFYETYSYKPTEIQICFDLKDIKAIIFIDDIELTRENLKRLIDIAPDFVFIITTAKLQLWGEDGFSYRISKLSDQDSLALVERNLGRALIKIEQNIALMLCKLLDGNLSEILKEIAIARAEDKTIFEVVQRLKSNQKTNPDDIIASLQITERKIVEILMILGDVSIQGRTITRLSKIKDSVLILDKLVSIGIVQKDGNDSYELALNARRILQQNWKPKECLEWLSPLLQEWVTQAETQPRQLIYDFNVLKRLINVSEYWGFWPNVLGLSQYTQEIFAQIGYWDAWEQILKWLLKAAQKLDDPVSEAFAYHQLGVRSLCLEEFSTSKTYLKKALKIRQSLGNEDAIQTSQQAFDFLSTAVTQADKVDILELIGSGIAGGLKPALLSTFVVASTFLGWNHFKPLFEQYNFGAKVEEVLSQQRTPNNDTGELNLSPGNDQIEEPQIGIKESSSYDEIAEQNRQCLQGTWKERKISQTHSIIPILELFPEEIIRYSGSKGDVQITFRKDNFIAYYGGLSHQFQLFHTPNLDPSSFTPNTEQLSLDINIELQGIVNSKIHQNVKQNFFKRSDVDFSRLRLETNMPSASRQILEEQFADNTFLTETEEPEEISELRKERILHMDDISELRHKILSIFRVPGPSMTIIQLEHALKNAEQTSRINYECDEDNLTLEYVNRQFKLERIFKRIY